MRRRTWAGALAVSATVAATVLAASPPAVAAPAAEALPGGPGVAVSIGDSYISGEAGRWLGNSAVTAQGHGGTDREFPAGAIFPDPLKIYGTTFVNGCHRSDVSPVHGVTGLKPKNLACAGARPVNIVRTSAGGTAQVEDEAPQDDQLLALASRSRVRMIALTVGGNELGFTPVIRACLQQYITAAGPCAPAQRATLADRLATTRAAVASALADVRATMSAAGYASSDYQFVVMGYPVPIAASTDIRYPEAGSQRLLSGGCPFYDADIDFAAAEMVPALDAAVHDAATAAGVQFLDTSAAFAGHQLCSKDTAQSDGTPTSAEGEWIRFIDLFGQGDIQEVLHPDVFGQAALGRCLDLIKGRTGDHACTGGAGRAADEVTLS